MTHTLMTLAIVVIVVGVILALVLWAIEQLPLPGPLPGIVRACAIIIAVLIVVSQLWPLMPN